MLPHACMNECFCLQVCVCVRVPTQASFHCVRIRILQRVSVRHGRLARQDNGQNSVAYAILEKSMSCRDFCMARSSQCVDAKPPGWKHVMCPRARSREGVCACLFARHPCDRKQDLLSDNRFDNHRVI